MWWVELWTLDSSVFVQQCVLFLFVLVLRVNLFNKPTAANAVLCIFDA